MAKAKVMEIAEALRDVLIENGFPEAEVRMLPYLTREEAGSDRRVVVIPSGATYDDGARAGFNRIYDLRVIIQKAESRHGKPDMEHAADNFVDLEGLVALWDEDGPLRSARLAGAFFSDGPDHPTGNMHEGVVLNEEHMFYTSISVRYGVYC